MRLQAAISQFQEHYFATRERSARTRVAYTIDLGHLTKCVDPDSDVTGLTYEVIACWVGSIRKTSAPATVRRRIATLRVFLNHCVARRVIPHSPLWGMRIEVGCIPQLVRTLSLMDVKGILTLIRDPVEECGKTRVARIRQARDRAIIEVLFATGLRVGELVRLRLTDWRESEGALFVHGKGGRQRLAFLVDPVSREALINYLRLRGAESNESASVAPLFKSTRGRSLSTQQVGRIVGSTARRATVARHVTCHMLRHTIATMLLGGGADLRVVQEFLGHASVSTTQRYTHVSKEHLVATLMRCHPNILHPAH